MSYMASSYRGFVRDLASAAYVPATTQMSAALFNSGLNTDPTVDLVTTNSANELTGGSYARVTGLTWTLANTDTGIAFTTLTPACTFAAFTGSWQYIVLFNSSSNRNYILIDTGVVNTQNNTTFTLSNSPEPFVTLNYA